MLQLVARKVPLNEQLLEVKRVKNESESFWSMRQAVSQLGQTAKPM